MGHYKVICAGEAVVGRSKTHDGAQKIVVMHRSCKSAKGSESAGAAKVYTVEFDNIEYPLDISGASRLGYVPTPQEKIKYPVGMCPY